MLQRRAPTRTGRPRPAGRRRGPGPRVPAQGPILHTTRLAALIPAEGGDVGLAVELFNRTLDQRLLETEQRAKSMADAADSRAAEAMKQAHQAVQAMGGAGFLNDSPVSRIFRDAKLMEIGAGTSEIRRMLIGRELMAI